MPECVRDYTAAYRAENDPLAEWLEMYCAFGEDLTVRAADLRASYEAWAEANGERPISARAWGEALRARGCERQRVQRERVWAGVGLEERDR